MRHGLPDNACASFRLVLYPEYFESRKLLVEPLVLSMMVNMRDYRVLPGCNSGFGLPTELASLCGELVQKPQGSLHQVL